MNNYRRAVARTFSSPGGQRWFWESLARYHALALRLAAGAQLRPDPGSTRRGGAPRGADTGDMEFQVPGADDSEAETVYQQLADAFSLTAAPLAERLESITWEADGDVMTATVGQTLNGQRTETRRGGSFTRTSADPATVLAIFPGEPTYVVTDAKPISSVPSSWNNPVTIGTKSIQTSTRFDPAGRQPIG